METGTSKGWYVSKITVLVVVLLRTDNSFLQKDSDV